MSGTEALWTVGDGYDELLYLVRRWREVLVGVELVQWIVMAVDEGGTPGVLGGCCGWDRDWGCAVEYMR